MDLATVQLLDSLSAVLKSQLKKLDCKDYQVSNRTQGNIRAAIRGLKGQGRPRKFLLASWQQAWNISPQAFILLASSFSECDLKRRGRHTLKHIMRLLQEQEDFISGHEGLCRLVANFLGDYKRTIVTELTSEPLQSNTITGIRSSKPAVHAKGNVVPVAMHDQLAPQKHEALHLAAIHAKGNSAPVAVHDQLTPQKVAALTLLQSLGYDSSFLVHLGTNHNDSNLQLLSNTTEEVQGLWNVSTSSLPIVLPSTSCWRRQPPTFKQLWVESAKLQSQDLHAFEYGERSDNVELAFYQMHESDPQNPVCIIGMQPPALVADNQFGSCPQLHQKVTTYLERTMAYNMTPKGSFVDLHIDHGWDGISSPLGECEKVWVIFPPTTYNLKWMANHRGQHAKLAHGIALLEGGVIVHTTSAQAIYLPAGCIHAVFTTVGGFLVSIDCVTKSSIWPFAQYLRNKLHLQLDDRQQRNCYFSFLECLEVTLQNAGEKEALRAWLSIDDILHKAKGNDRPWLKKAQKVWRGFLDANFTDDMACPCQNTFRMSFEEHLMDHHLGWVFEQECKGAEQRPVQTRARSGRTVRNLR